MATEPKPTTLLEIQRAAQAGTAADPSREPETLSELQRQSSSTTFLELMQRNPPKPIPENQ